VDLYGSLFERVLWPLWEGGLRRRPTLRLWRALEASQWRPLAELEAQQAEALRHLADHARAHVPFYRELFERAGVGPGEIRAPADLRRLPILSAADLRGTGARRRSTVSPFPTISKSTGGSTGRPLEFGYDPLSEYWRLATKLRGYGWAGFRPGVRSLHFWGALPVRRSWGRRQKIALDHWLRREHYVDCGRRDDAVLEGVVRAIRRERPGAILCYAQAGAELARWINERSARTWGPILVLCGAEALTSPDRAALEEAFGPGVFETYGCREVMLIGAECPAHAGLHLSLENLVVELVVRDGSGERPARPGEVGEVVLTDLHNLGMPFIRYANGDLAVAAPPGRCACGRELPRLERVEGRVTETLRDGEGRRVNGLLFNIVLTALPTGARQWQAVQHRDGSVSLQIVPTGALDEALRGRILEATSRWLQGVPVRLETVAEIPPAPNGKRPLVRVER
jgi:phenylacetate-CoA ligase